MGIAVTDAMYCCDECGLEFSGRQEFLTHQINSHSDNLQLYKCEHCSFASLNHNKLCLHQAVHTNLSPVASDQENNSDVACKTPLKCAATKTPMLQVCSDDIEEPEINHSESIPKSQESEKSPQSNDQSSVVEKTESVGKTDPKSTSDPSAIGEKPRPGLRDAEKPSSKKQEVDCNQNTEAPLHPVDGAGTSDVKIQPEPLKTTQLSSPQPDSQRIHCPSSSCNYSSTWKHEVYHHIQSCKSAQESIYPDTAAQFIQNLQVCKPPITPESIRKEVIMSKQISTLPIKAGNYNRHPWKHPTQNGQKQNHKPYIRGKPTKPTVKGFNGPIPEVASWLKHTVQPSVVPISMKPAKSVPQPLNERPPANIPSAPSKPGLRPEGVYACGHCSFTTWKQDEINQHILGHGRHSIKPPLRTKAYKCRHCLYSSSSELCMVNHLLMIHINFLFPTPPNGNGSTTFSCPYCLHVNTKDNMINHMLHHYQDHLPCNNCEVCNKRFPNGATSQASLVNALSLPSSGPGTVSITVNKVITSTQNSSSHIGSFHHTPSTACDSVLVQAPSSAQDKTIVTTAGLSQRMPLSSKASSVVIHHKATMSPNSTTKTQLHQSKPDSSLPLKKRATKPSDIPSPTSKPAKPSRETNLNHIRCKQCDKTVDNVNALRFHKYIVHNETRPSMEKDTISCLMDDMRKESGTSSGLKTVETSLVVTLPRQVSALLQSPVVPLNETNTTVSALINSLEKKTASSFASPPIPPMEITGPKPASGSNISQPASNQSPTSGNLRVTLVKENGKWTQASYPSSDAAQLKDGVKMDSISSVLTDEGADSTKSEKSYAHYVKPSSTKHPSVITLSKSPILIPSENRNAPELTKVTDVKVECSESNGTVSQKDSPPEGESKSVVKVIQSNPTIIEIFDEESDDDDVIFISEQLAKPSAPFTPLKIPKRNTPETRLTYAKMKVNGLNTNSDTVPISLGKAIPLVTELCSATVLESQKMMSPIVVTTTFAWCTPTKFQPVIGHDGNPVAEAISPRASTNLNSESSPVRLSSEKILLLKEKLSQVAQKRNGTPPSESGHSETATDHHPESPKVNEKMVSTEANTAVCKKLLSDSGHSETYTDCYPNSPKGNKKTLSTEASAIVSSKKLLFDSGRGKTATNHNPDSTKGNKKALLTEASSIGCKKLLSDSGHCEASTGHHVDLPKGNKKPLPTESSDIVCKELSDFDHSKTFTDRHTHSTKGNKKRPSTEPSDIVCKKFQSDSSHSRTSADHQPNSNEEDKMPLAEPSDAVCRKLSVGRDPIPSVDSQISNKQSKSQAQVTKDQEDAKPVVLEKLVVKLRQDTQTNLLSSDDHQLPSATTSDDNRKRPVPEEKKEDGKKICFSQERNVMSKRKTSKISKSTVVSKPLKNNQQEPLGSIVRVSTDNHLKDCSIPLLRLSQIKSASTQTYPLIDDTLVSCNLCPKKLIYRSLPLHLLGHTKNCKYKCNQCSFSSSKRWVLDSHLIVHSEPDSSPARKLTVEEWATVEQSATDDKELVSRLYQDDLTDIHRSKPGKRVARKTGVNGSNNFARKSHRSTNKERCNSGTKRNGIESGAPNVLDKHLAIDAASFFENM